MILAKTVQLFNLNSKITKKREVLPDKTPRFLCKNETLCRKHMMYIESYKQKCYIMVANIRCIINPK